MHALRHALPANIPVSLASTVLYMLLFRWQFDHWDLGCNPSVRLLCLGVWAEGARPLSLSLFRQGSGLEGFPSRRAVGAPDRCGGAWKDTVRYRGNFS